MSERTDLAEDRTELAEDRTVLAHERSFAGWVRTGMACVGVGLGFTALLRAAEPQWIPKLIATGFLAIGAFIFLSAERRACAITAELEAHRVFALKPMRIRLLARALTVVTAGLAVVIWTLLDV